MIAGGNVDLRPHVTAREWSSFRIMDNRSTISLLAAVAILSAILGLSYGATFNGACAMIKDAPLGCVEWWLSRYQTLIAVAGAIFAAWLGIQPVLGQLKLSSLQTAATLQQVYTTRERLLESDFKQEINALEKLATDLARGLYHGDGDRSILTHWVWDMNQEVDRIQESLLQTRMKALDGDAMATARESLIDRLGRLSICMSHYNATVRADDPEEVASEEVMAMALEAELQAEKDLPERTDEVRKGINELRDAFAVDLQELRGKRQINDRILASAALPAERERR
jgi:hypothetical protein